MEDYASLKFLATSPHEFLATSPLHYCSQSKISTAAARDHNRLLADKIHAMLEIDVQVNDALEVKKGFRV